jgi:O-antigen/teichoic acid export membrane protein
LGARWEMAGVFTGYLGYYYIFRLTGQATGMIYNVLQRQQFALLTNTLLLLTRGAGLAIGIWMKDVNMAMLLFGLSSLVSTFLIDLHILYLLKLPVVRIAFRTILLMAVALGFFYLLRIGFNQLHIQLRYL